MHHLGNELDQYLLDLAWSLWTELGVAGVKRKHQNFLIPLEELILLTVALAEIDPRLRDESLDWCVQYHRFFSIARLKSILKSFGNSLIEPFSSYAVTLNALSGTAWPIFLDLPPMQVTPSHKSRLRSLTLPALLTIRMRSTFGVGARADLMTFFLMNAQADFSASDLVEIGYSKRNLAEILEEFCLGGLFDKFMLRNQQRYRLNKNRQQVQVFGAIPEHAPLWRIFFELLLSLRNCIKHTANSSDSTKVVEIRNLLLSHQKQLQRLNLTPPPMQTNFNAYLNSFGEWLIGIARSLAQGKAGGSP